jgi:uncharacterized membrane protein
VAESVTVIAGIPVPSTSPVFLGVVGAHVLIGLTCVVAGAAAMLSRKGRGRHSTLGSVYFWGLVAIFVTSTCLALARWDEDYPLFVLGALALASAWIARRAVRQRSTGWPRWHISGMGASYILLLTAFYVDNGRNLPVWRALPQIAFWLLPGAFGAPIIAWALLRHPLVRRR